MTQYREHFLSSFDLGMVPWAPNALSQASWQHTTRATASPGTRTL